MRTTTHGLSALFLWSSAYHSFAAELALPDASQLDGTWTYQGCYTDVGRTINSGATSSNNMTIETCLAFCADGDYAYAGTEYHNECYCGNKLATRAAEVNSTDCNTACSGNQTQPCGGANRLTMFFNPYITGPQPNIGIANWTHIGCYTEGNGGRALGFGAPVAGNQVNAATCTAACRAAGYILAGIEYGGECFCGDTIAFNATTADEGCSMPCNGNKTEVCGGPNRLNVYDFNMQYNITTSTSPVPPTTSSTVRPSSSTSAVDIPSSAVATPTASPTVDVTSASSTVILNSASSTIIVTSTSSTVVTSTSSTVVATPLSSARVLDAAAGPVFPTGWTNQGCWQDGPNGRILPTMIAETNNMTQEYCAQLCSGQKYTISGTEYYGQCFCGNAVYNGGVRSPTTTNCNTPCKGNNTQMCGGPGYLTIYSNGTPRVFQLPGPQKDNLNGTWTYKGCYVDNINQQRTLPWALRFPGTNTANVCLGACGAFGYPIAAMEYGEECYCGDPIDITNAGSTVRPESECAQPCAGNASTICGGGSRLSLYQWSGATPLYTFSYPQGNNAGRYSNLVGGVVTPLMTMQSITGKVTFLEKFGTGAANSTGAYELDLSQTGDFSRAWRTMHLKTDVFCSAGVILPDKAGRQLTIGGWSLDSTYGVRLYSPNGSPGVPGTNDWEENVNTLRLQRGRWYPSAMVMTNGSVLVVGGEIGSNDRPEPSLEILPRAGPYLYMDWLERTDPNNLYPFLAVLPGGGIFVAYWNEARILNAATFQTTKTLPNMPGSVADPLGGRTYPLEGTAVLLPQYAPYTDPLGVLICGGSTPGFQALDNCVSTQPEAANPTWTLERMPSKRVLTCMAPLPDGTYLIANGARQGVAGFGLATSPNLNAVLYDPRKPVGSRMSIMANTSVARLYHSEAITLLDGRVLITGSDPQDGVNPQEIRVEVFTPPYLLSTKPRPSFTITNKDWGYGAVVTFTLGRAPVGALQVSLLGAVSSTHGNSMGARTLFPAVSCTGTSCQVTAPPNGRVSPPGWYQMFVVDDGIPAVGTYVRIGGDPGRLGNWPQGPDFHPPGI